MLDETPLAPLGPAGLVFMASGQGSQKPGMGADMLDISEVASVFACASDVLGRDVAALVRDASPEELNDTRNAQIAIAALSVGMGRALEARGIVPDALLGFSLGQISAMVLGGMLVEEDAFALIAERSRLMGEAADANPGVMSALLKITLPEAEVLCAQCAEGEVLVPANLNGGGQIVVAGTPAAVARAEEAWAASKGRFSRLATSGAFHSPLMVPAQEPFADYLAQVEFRRWCRSSATCTPRRLTPPALATSWWRTWCRPCSSRPAWQSFRRPARRCSRKWASAACSPIS